MRKADAGWLAAALAVGALLVVPEAAMAAKDKFVIRCVEKGDAQKGKDPEYQCVIETGAFVKDGPKKPTGPNGEKFPRERDFVLDMDLLKLNEPVGKGPINVDACPGWFFRNGKWIYYPLATPCPPP
ncbi:MAG: hypothetical protein J0M16_05885 [Gammaproteobacteria bacterium]|nr:hypothetical protein [Gammaproteobacteria bacterium]